MPKPDVEQNNTKINDFQYSKKMRKTIKKGKAPIYGPQPDGSYRSPLGWVFSAQDCRREAEARREAAAWFKRRYEKRPQPSVTFVPSIKTKEEEETLNRNDAMMYLGVGASVMAYGVKTGLLPYRKRRGNTSGTSRMPYYYRREDLDRFKKELERRKNKDFKL